MYILVNINGVCNKAYPGLRKLYLVMADHYLSIGSVKLPMKHRREFIFNDTGYTEPVYFKTIEDAEHAKVRYLRTYCHLNWIDELKYGHIIVFTVKDYLHEAIIDKLRGRDTIYQIPKLLQEHYDVYSCPDFQ